MPTAQKAAVIDELVDQLSRAQLAVLTDYRGLNVTALQGFRTSLRPVGAELRIAKNTLTRLAAERVGITGLEGSLEGPLALVLVYDDIVGASKAVTDFVRTSRVLTVKGAVLNNRFIAAGDVEALATMPSRAELLSKLLGLMNSPMQRTVTVLNGPSQSIAYLLQSRSDQLAGAAQAAE